MKLYTQLRYPASILAHVWTRVKHVQLFKNNY